MLTAILKRFGSSVISAFRVDDDEVVGGSGDAGAKNGGNIVEQKVGSIVQSIWSTRKVSTNPVDLRELV